MVKKKKQREGPDAPGKEALNAASCMNQTRNDSSDHARQNVSLIQLLTNESAGSQGVCLCSVVSMSC